MWIRQTNLKIILKKKWSYKTPTRVIVLYFLPKKSKWHVPEDILLLSMPNSIQNILYKQVLKIHACLEDIYLENVYLFKNKILSCLWFEKTFFNFRFSVSLFKNNLYIFNDRYWSTLVILKCIYKIKRNRYFIKCYKFSLLSNIRYYKHSYINIG